MIRHRYTCKLLSDVVITSVTATEGFHESLDYIPGAKFLGIAAGVLYDMHDQSALDLFHNGKVRFGNAYPLLNGETALPAPFSWYFEKGKSPVQPPVYLYHYLEDADFIEISRSTQLKQSRKGYFTPSGKYWTIDQDFALRSAYDSEKRRAKDKSMFGYFSLPQGSEWSFVIEDDTGYYAELIKSALIGKKRIGRSRSAEYGLVEISFEAMEEVSDNVNHLDTGFNLVYAQSNLCFYDEQLFTNTLTPSAAQLGFPTGEIDWEKSQLRYRVYQTWNRKRHNRDADRMIIEKGTVFVIKNSKSVDYDTLRIGVGSHLSEGFGKVMLNPFFLKSASIELDLKLVRAELNNSSAGNDLPTLQDTVVANFLREKEAAQAQTRNFDRLINDFVREKEGIFKGVPPSQWGVIRAYARQADSWQELSGWLFNEESGALHRGQSETIWRKNNRRSNLQRFIEQHTEEERIPFILKLAAEMAKRKIKKG